jgi:DNA segregation ATPase FtsK/SpoIIIE, S-DNA-T family
MGAAEKNTATLPAKLASLVREAKWLVLVALALYLLLIFATFNRGDPGWSHSATGEAVRNAGGAVGAWISDLALYLFGLSAYWWVALCAYIVV